MIIWFVLWLGASLFSHTLSHGCYLLAFSLPGTSEGVFELIQWAVLTFLVHGLWEKKSQIQPSSSCTAASPLCPRLLNPWRSFLWRLLLIWSWPWGMKIWAKAQNNKIAEVSNTNNKNAWKDLCLYKTVLHMYCLIWELPMGIIRNCFKVIFEYLSFCVYL